jgi:putative tryptophan/tyrosine transport system substrate-binding protein
MRRREFITLLGGAAAAWPHAALAQQVGKLPTVGFLVGGTRAIFAPWIAAFTQRLSELGWVEGRSIAIEYRVAEGHNERYAEIADEFVRMKVDVIVASGGAAFIVKQATSVIPIVMPAATDPVGSGMVGSLARPGGNVTGTSVIATDIAGKRLELLREIIPGLRRLGVMGNAGYPAAVIEMRTVRTLAEGLGLHCINLEIRRTDDFDAAIAQAKDRTDALYVTADPLINTNRVRIATLTLGARLPTMHGLRELVDAGGLISYGPSFPDLYRRAAELVDKILRGAKPSDIPVEQPTKFELVVNLTTAKALGLTIPESFLSLADDVIE